MSASVKDAPSVKNVASVLQQVGYEDVLIIVSAMGKTTNALEEIVATYQNNPAQLKTAIQALEAFHLNIVSALMGENSTELEDKVRNSLEKCFLEHNKSPNCSFVYQTVYLGS